MPHRISKTPGPGRQIQADRDSTKLHPYPTECWPQQARAVLAQPRSSTVANPLRAAPVSGHVRKVGDRERAFSPNSSDCNIENACMPRVHPSHRGCAPSHHASRTCSMQHATCGRSHVPWILAHARLVSRAKSTGPSALPRRRRYHEAPGRSLQARRSAAASDLLCSRAARELGCPLSSCRAAAGSACGAARHLGAPGLQRAELPPVAHRRRPLSPRCAHGAAAEAADPRGRGVPHGAEESPRARGPPAGGGEGCGTARQSGGPADAAGHDALLRGCWGSSRRSRHRFGRPCALPEGHLRVRRCLATVARDEPGEHSGRGARARCGLCPPGVRHAVPRGGRRAAQLPCGTLGAPLRRCGEVRFSDGLPGGQGAAAGSHAPELPVLAEAGQGHPREPLRARAGEGLGQDEVPSEQDLRDGHAHGQLARGPQLSSQQHARPPAAGGRNAPRAGERRSRPARAELRELPRRAGRPDGRPRAASGRPAGQQRGARSCSKDTQRPRSARLRAGTKHDGHGLRGGREPLPYQARLPLGLPRPGRAVRHGRRARAACPAQGRREGPEQVREPERGQAHCLSRPYKAGTQARAEHVSQHAQEPGREHAHKRDSRDDGRRRLRPRRRDVRERHSGAREGERLARGSAHLQHDGAAEPPPLRV
eukprot:scaffold1199_cov265-Pinguiococcus_pyrenoidosus.AAC.18